MKDFPEQFATEESCFRYLMGYRWPKGFVCLHCRSRKYWIRIKRRLLVCQGCRREISPTAGTLMHRSHIPLQEWFCAIHLLSTLPFGLSAVQLQKRLGVGSYQTAWSLLHRLHKGMVQKSKRSLSGSVEAGEKLLFKHYHIYGVVELGGGGGVPKGLRLQSTEKSDEKSFLAFLKKYVQKNPLIQLMPEVSASALNQIFSNLENWLKVTHHRVGQKYLQEYLDEYVYLFDHSKNQVKKFQTLLSLLLKPIKNSS